MELVCMRKRKEKYVWTSPTQTQKQAQKTCFHHICARIFICVCVAHVNQAFYYVPAWIFMRTLLLLFFSTDGSKAWVKNLFQKYRRNDAISGIILRLHATKYVPHDTLQQEVVSLREQAFYSRQSVMAGLLTLTIAWFWNNEAHKREIKRRRGIRNSRHF